MNNNPNQQNREREISNQKQKRPANPLQKSVQLPPNDGQISYGSGAQQQEQKRASNLMLENNNFIKKFTDFGE